MKKLSMDELNRKTVEQFKNSEKQPVIIVLDNIRSLHNVGSVFRTADAFMVSKIYLCGITGTPPNREITKTALGATESVEWEYASITLDVIQNLKKEGWKIISLEQTDQSIGLQHFFPEKKEKYCFVFGNEVFGVSQEVLELSDTAVEIPQFGTKHSLNISVTAGITIWDYFLKRFSE
jgi:tRNA G18 (ribose-2'-O)-methylase SpoU